MTPINFMKDDDDNDDDDNDDDEDVPECCGGMRVEGCEMGVEGRGLK